VFIFFFETSSQLKVWQAIGASFFPRRLNDRSVHFLSYPFGASTSSSFHLYSLLQRVQVNVLHRTCFPKWQRLRSFDNSPGASNAVEDQNTFQNPSHGGAALWSFGKQPSHTSCHSTQHDLESVVTRWASPNRPAPRPPRRVDHHVRGGRLVKGNGTAPPLPRAPPPA